MAVDAMDGTDGMDEAQEQESPPAAFSPKANVFSSASGLVYVNDAIAGGNGRGTHVPANPSQPQRAHALTLVHSISTVVLNWFYKRVRLDVDGQEMTRSLCPVCGDADLVIPQSREPHLLQHLGRIMFVCNW
jgi:hypothetical protein